MSFPFAYICTYIQLHPLPPPPPPPPHPSPPIEPHHRLFQYNHHTRTACCAAEGYQSSQEQKGERKTRDTTHRPRRFRTARDDRTDRMLKTKREIEIIHTKEWSKLVRERGRSGTRGKPNDRALLWKRLRIGSISAAYRVGSALARP